MKLDADEKELLESVERREWKSAGGGKRERTRYARYAKATFRKDRRLNIRLSSKDLEAIQKRALAEGLPYQTLISSLLHKYAAGRFAHPRQVDHRSVVAHGISGHTMAAASNRDEEIVFASEHHGLAHVGNARTSHDESREPIDHRVEHHTRPVVAVVIAAKDDTKNSRAKTVDGYVRQYDLRA